MTLKWRGYVLLALVGAFGATPAAQAQKMYWSDFGGIVRANLDGTDIEVVVADFRGVRGIALDSIRGKIYWTCAGADTIHRANLDGSQIESLITTGLDQPWGIALDLARGKMYWANRLARRIQRANLDGTGVEDVVFTESGPTAIRLDLHAEKVYWAGSAKNRIRRANLDGTAVEDSVTNATFFIGSMALDTGDSQVYYTLAVGGLAGAFFPGLMHRANLDGSSVEELIVMERGAEPYGIALDISAGKMYWTELAAGKIHRANLDGSGIELLVSGGGTRDIALDLPGNAIPTLSYWGLVVMTLGMLTLARLLRLRRVSTQRM